MNGEVCLYLLNKKTCKCYLQVFFLGKDKSMHYKTCSKRLIKILWASFNTFTFLAFSLIFKLAIINHCFHYDFATAVRANEFLCCNSSTRVFTSSSHYVPPIEYSFYNNND